MVKIIIAFLVILSSLIYSEEIIKTKDGKRVILKDDFTWCYIKTAASNIYFAEDAVSVWDKQLLREDSEYEKILGLFLHYFNKTDRKIIGIEVKVVIINPFGEIVLSKIFQDEIVLQPNQTMKNSMYFAFKDNQFTNDEPYDRMWQMADNGTAKIQTKILKVILDDGTILLPRPPNPKTTLNK